MCFYQRTVSLIKNPIKLSSFLDLCFLFYVVMENYKNVPKHLYGLTPSQMDMFMTEDNPIRKQSERVTEVLILYLLLIWSK